MIGTAVNNKRAYLRGEGETRAEWGMSLVVVNSRQGGCPDCAKYIGKVFIDDVYSNGRKSDGNYPLLSTAIKNGLFHPCCKDSTSTYYPELDDLDGPLSEDEIAQLDRQRGLEEKQQYAERQAQRFDRRAEYSLDDDNKRIAQKRADEWHDKADVLEEKVKRTEDVNRITAENVAKSAESGIIKENQLSELGKFKKRIRSDNSMSEEYYSAVKKKFSHGSDTAKAAFNKFIPEDSVANSNFEGTPHYSPLTKKVSMHYKSDLHGERGSCVTWFHEHGHMLDDMAGKVSNNSEFLDALNSDYMTYMKAYGKKNGLKTFGKVQSAISFDLSSMREHSAVSDILEGISHGNIRGVAGHMSGYWKNDSVICSEAFAHMFEAQFDDVRYVQMKKYFPNALAKFESVLEGLIKC